ncbi:hypothetical protein L916_15482 [Phytophthora nicotianae]|uniref:ABC-2 type transporter transmembrane domain-containing protein n=2 Tax=Phytophthora nicotianae TaxID=4792 RepID=W2IEK5_PHYNI|nr:hypothetical protein L916_15482 [Phytophthora nicotianae]ETO66949.1 hypothetical protein F444_16012 [Phytophthora nicotianae P1976]
MYSNRLNIRDPGIYWVHLFMYIYLSFMVGTMYLSTNDDLTEEGLMTLLFYVYAFLVFMSVPLLPFFIEQRAMFARERASSSLSVVLQIPGHVARHLPDHSNVDSAGGTADGSQRRRTLPVEHVPVAGGVQDLIGAAAPRNIIGIAQDGVSGIIMR